MMKKAVSLLLVLTLVLGLTVPVVAAGPTFTDVPETHWAYADVEAVAAAGLMNGTGNGEFSPDLKVSVAQFLTLLGRLVFPDTKVTEGASWYGPYVIAARTNGLLEGTQVDITNVEAEISRYDMAVILRAAAKKLGVMEKPTQTSQVKDYGEIPTKYAQAVLAVYGMELIKGDQAGNFNGSNTMMRAEVATVIMRLAKAKPGSSQGGGVEPTTSPEPSSNPEVTPSQAPNMVHISLEVHACHPVPYSEAVGQGYRLINDSAPFKLLYTESGGKTSAVVAEGFSQSFTPETSWDDQTLEFDVDRNVVVAGAGEFYLSGEMDYEGVHYATHDLRTDGRATVVPLDMERVLQGYVSQRVEMVPAATGYQRIVTLDRHYAINGSVYSGRRMEAQCIYYSNPEDALSVKLWSQTPLGGTLLASAPLDSNGDYQMEFGVDILDYNPYLAHYAVYIVDADDGTYLGGGNLRTLNQLTSFGGAIE